MCELCVSETSCWCGNCIAWPNKPCPHCHHFRAFYVLKIRKNWKKGTIKVNIK